MLKAIIEKVKSFFKAVLSIGNPLKKWGPEADKLLLEFVSSESGKAAFAGLKKADKEGLEKILILLTGKVQALTKDNPRITKIILDYLKNKILLLAQ